MATTDTVSVSKQKFLEISARENATTLRVLRAYPADRADLQPHPKCKSARELAWMFVLEQGLMEKALTTGFDWSKPSPPRPAPDSLAAVIDELDAVQRRVARLVEESSDEQLLETVPFLTGPKTMGEYRKIDFLWFILHDQIHHRGQFTIYLRMADGKVPSIYGPTADEPWR
jgi:uncharacterized damage-inducible protein DinB